MSAAQVRTPKWFQDAITGDFVCTDGRRYTPLEAATESAPPFACSRAIRSGRRRAALAEAEREEGGAS